MAEKKSAALALTSAILLMLALAGPTIAYVEALRAPEYVIRDNHRRLAEAVRDQAYSSSIFAYSLAPRGDPPEMNACDLDLIRAAHKKGGMAVEFAYETIFAIDLSEEAAVRRAISDGSPLNDSSWAKLAVLKGCMDASILAPLCKKHVWDLRVSAPAYQQRANDALKAASRRSDEHRCAVVAYLKPRL